MFDLKEAFRIDTSRRPSMGQRLQATKAELSSSTEKTDSAAIEPADGEWTADVAASANMPATDTEKIDFLLKLCQALLAYGQCTVDAEERTTNAAITMGLPVPVLDVGPRCMHAAFEGIKSSHLQTTRDIVLCKLQDVTELAIHAATQGQNYTRQDVEAACVLLEEISKEPLPYGWIIQDILFVWLCTMAAIGAFFGSYSDMLVVFIISLFILGIKKLITRFPMVLAPLELILVPAVSGLLTAAAYRIASNDTGDKPCNIPIIFLSPLLVYLPGSELIYGAYEVLMGHFTVGAARLVSSLVKCMVIALGLTIGWQFTGYNLMKDTIDIQGGVEASFVPKDKCAPFTQPQNISPWWMVFGVWNLVMLIPVLGGLQVRPRDMLMNYGIAYLSLVLFGALNFAGSEGEGVGLNEFLVDIIGLFFATNLSCLREYVTGVPGE